MRSLLTILAAMLAASAFPADAPAGLDRPRVALVLGGGGAKGAAHIGVLQVLEEMRVPVHCIAGTSMGALVGGIYATGRPAGDIERAVLGIDWAEAVGGQGLRDRMPIDRKLTALTYTNSIEFGIGEDGINPPEALIDTSDIESLIWQLVADQQFTDDFDALPIPFRAVATDMVSGDMVVLDTGELATAMRASMAIPGAFAPVVRGEQVLADGGMTRRLPVDVGRELCGDVVIAVWLDSPNPSAGELDSAVMLAARSLDLMIDANEDRQIETLSESDIGIGVPMGDIHAGSFERVPEAIVRGREAAQANRAALRRYAVSEDDYRAWRRSVSDSSADTFRLAELRVVDTERVNADYVLARLDDVEKGASVASDRITAYAQRVHALGDFERVEYRLSGPESGRVLEIRPVEKSWGPDFLRFDLGLASQGDGDLRALLRADHERTWINRRGGRWHNTVQIGRQTIVATDFYQPLDIGQRFFLQPMLTFERNLEDLYVDGERGAQYFLNEAYGQFDVGINFDTRAQLRVGLRRGWQQAELDTGTPGLPELDRTADTSVQYRFIFDTRNQVALPTDGVFLNARYMHSEDWFGGDLDYRIWEAVFEQAFEFRGNSLRLILGGGNTIEGEPPLSRTIQLGGIRTFPGLRPGELRGRDYWLAGSSYSWRLAELQPVFGQALYAGLRLQAAEVGERYDGIDDGTLWGLSGSLSGVTPVGPFILSLGYVDNDSWRLQFSLGRPMTEGSLLDEIH